MAGSGCIRSTKKYGAWPASGEIDVAEWWSYEPDLVLPSLHFDGRDPDVDSGWDCLVEDVMPSTPTRSSGGPPRSASTSTGGRASHAYCRRRLSPLVAPQPFDHAFHMILNLGVLTQAHWSWRTQFPAELVVDYAKAWR